MFGLRHYRFNFVFLLLFEKEIILQGFFVFPVRASSAWDIIKVNGS